MLGGARAGDRPGVGAWAGWGSKLAPWTHLLQRAWASFSRAAPRGAGPGLLLKVAPTAADLDSAPPYHRPTWEARSHSRAGVLNIWNPLLNPLSS